jgi:hypothetical protein
MPSILAGKAHQEHVSALCDAVFAIGIDAGLRVGPIAFCKGSRDLHCLGMVNSFMSRICHNSNVLRALLQRNFKYRMSIHALDSTKFQEVLVTTCARASGSSILTCFTGFNYRTTESLDIYVWPDKLLPLVAFLNESGYKCVRGDEDDADAHHEHSVLEYYHNDSGQRLNVVFGEWSHNANEYSCVGVDNSDDMTSFDGTTFRIWPPRDMIRGFGRLGLPVDDESVLTAFYMNFFRSEWVDMHMDLITYNEPGGRNNGMQNRSDDAKRSLLGAKYEDDMIRVFGHYDEVIHESLLPSLCACAPGLLTFTFFRFQERMDMYRAKWVRMHMNMLAYNETSGRAENRCDEGKAGRLYVLKNDALQATNRVCDPHPNGTCTWSGPYDIEVDQGLWEMCVKYEVNHESVLPSLCACAPGLLTCTFSRCFQERMDIHRSKWVRYAQE